VYREGKSSFTGDLMHGIMLALPTALRDLITEEVEPFVELPLFLF
jgi:hypothetical protein